jgi:hypothetical protein
MLRAKAEGGAPRVTTPKGSDHAMRGGAMWNASKALEADPAQAWADLCAYIIKERAAERAAA